MNSTSTTSTSNHDASGHGTWAAHALPLTLITIDLQGTRHSDLDGMISLLEEVVVRLKAGEVRGESSDDDFGYRFALEIAHSRPSLFGDLPCSHTSISRGGDLEEVTLDPTLVALMEDAETEAARGCGQSDVLYEARVQAAYASILDRAPEADRAETEAALRQRGFDPDFVPYQAGQGECSLTGIDVDCCPCGRHP